MKMVITGIRLVIMMVIVDIDAQPLEEVYVEGGRLRAPEFQADGGWGARLRASEFQADGGWGARLRASEFQADGGWDEIEEAEDEKEELVEAEVAEFITELVSVYGTQDTESFESLVSEEYREVRASDEGEEHLDYDALIDAVRDEAHLANALLITHSILGVRSGKNGVQVKIQWQMRFEDAQSGEGKSRKGVTGLGLAQVGGFEEWQLITQRGKPLFGSTTSANLRGTESRGRRDRPTRPGRDRN